MLAYHTIKKILISNFNQIEYVSCQHLNISLTYNGYEEVGYSCKWKTNLLLRGTNCFVKENDSIFIRRTQLHQYFVDRFRCHLFFFRITVIIVLSKQSNYTCIKMVILTCISNKSVDRFLHVLVIKV